MRKKLLCIILAVITLAMLTSVVIAASNDIDHAKTPKNLNAERSEILHSRHAAHPGDEICKYCCEYWESFDEENEKVWSEETAKAFIDAFSACETDEEAALVISDFFDIPLEDINMEDFYSGDKRPGSTKDYYCPPHTDYIAGSCMGDHFNLSGCTVWCRRLAVCGLCRKKSTQIIVSYPEECHDWSVGWCGQTCKRCGKIELFHAPGGCWYCS